MASTDTVQKGFEVLVFCSDQHTADVTGFMGDPIARTPCLDTIANRGAVFENAYTSCPLCSPARASFMTSRVPSRLGMFNNACDFKSSEITFAHLHALIGYEATLIGRMHFNGMDHYHGFTKRVGKDLTGSYWGYSAENREDLKNYAAGLRQNGCLELIGSGDTPVREYDRQVIGEALEYLSHDYDKPQLMVVGTYGPHFPYIGDAARMDKYRLALSAVYKESVPGFTVPALQKKVQNASKEDIIELRAAYYALVEEMDEQIGQVYEAFQAYLARCKRPGIFIYMSDHGDQLGHMGLYGKQTFFEKSAKIPLVFEVDGVAPLRVSESVSIMDIGPTLCELNGTLAAPGIDGRSFADLLKGGHVPGRCAQAEFYEAQADHCDVGRMLHQDGWKLISYNAGQDMLFHTAADPDEQINLIVQQPQLYRRMKELLEHGAVAADRTKDYLDSIARHRVLSKIGANHPEYNPFTYIASNAVQGLKKEWIRPKNS